MDKVKEERQNEANSYFSMLYHEKITTAFYLFRSKSGSVFGGNTCVHAREKGTFI
jgi:hypothetical protein